MANNTYLDETGLAHLWEKIKDTVGDSQMVFYCNCNASGSDVNKAVTTSENFVLQTGTLIVVAFANKNTADNVTLNVNGTGANSIIRAGALYTGSDPSVTGMGDNKCIYYVYNGGYWVWLGSDSIAVSNGDLGIGYATCETAESTTAKVATYGGTYKLVNGGIVTVLFANSVPAGSTLNIDGTGALPIHFNGALSESLSAIQANSKATFINVSNTYYQLIATTKIPVEYAQNPLTATISGTETTIGTLDAIYSPWFSKIVNVSGVITETVTGDTYANQYPYSATKVNSLLSSKANLASPAFTGNPTATTQAAGNNSTRIATTAFVTTAVDNALASITSISYSIVSSLPASGETGVIYLVAHTHGTKDVYDEYIWTGSDFEKIGNTDIDLSNYVQKGDYTPITNATIDTICV